MHCTRTITLFRVLLELLPFVNFTLGFLSGDNFQSIEANNLKLQTKINHITEICTVQEPLVYSNYIIFEVNALCKCNDFSHSSGTSMIIFFYKMTPVLLQGAVWGFAALCDSSSFYFHRMTISYGFEEEND